MSQGELQSPTSTPFIEQHETCKQQKPLDFTFVKTAISRNFEQDNNQAKIEIRGLDVSKKTKIETKYIVSEYDIGVMPFSSNIQKEHGLSDGKDDFSALEKQNNIHLIECELEFTKNQHIDSFKTSSILQNKQKQAVVVPNSDCSLFKSTKAEIDFSASSHSRVNDGQIFKKASSLQELGFLVSVCEHANDLAHLADVSNNMLVSGESTEQPPQQQLSLRQHLSFNSSESRNRSNSLKFKNTSTCTDYGDKCENLKSVQQQGISETFKVLNTGEERRSNFPILLEGLNHWISNGFSSVERQENELCCERGIWDKCTSDLSNSAVNFRQSQNKEVSTEPVWSFWKVNNENFGPSVSHNSSSIQSSIHQHSSYNGISKLENTIPQSQALNDSLSRNQNSLNHISKKSVNSIKSKDSLKLLSNNPFANYHQSDPSTTPQQILYDSPGLFKIWDDSNQPASLAQKRSAKSSSNVLSCKSNKISEHEKDNGLEIFQTLDTRNNTLEKALIFDIQKALADELKANSKGYENDGASRNYILDTSDKNKISELNNGSNTEDIDSMQAANTFKELEKMKKRLEEIHREAAIAASSDNRKTEYVKYQNNSIQHKQKGQELLLKPSKNEMTSFQENEKHYGSFTIDKFINQHAAQNAFKEAGSEDFSAFEFSPNDNEAQNSFNKNAIDVNTIDSNLATAGKSQESSFKNNDVNAQQNYVSYNSHEIKSLVEDINQTDWMNAERFRQNEVVSRRQKHQVPSVKNNLTNLESISRLVDQPKLSAQSQKKPFARKNNEASTRECANSTLDRSEVISGDKGCGFRIFRKKEKAWSKKVKEKLSRVISLVNRQRHRN